MKPLVFLDSSLPKTSRTPTLPTGEIDYDRLERLVDLSTEYRFSGADEDELRARLKAEYNALKEGVIFDERPHFVQIRLMGGELSGVPADQPEMISCHPETWALATDEMREKFDVIEEMNAARGSTSDSV